MRDGRRDVRGELARADMSGVLNTRELLNIASLLQCARLVKAYGEAAPKAWTLDVAVTTDSKTVVLECHRFFSCGLYGFSDLRRIPKMYSQTWYEMIMPKNIFKDS